MSGTPACDPKAGASNLLRDCLDVAEHDRILIVREDDGFGPYDVSAVDCVAQVAAELGANVMVRVANDVDGPGQVPASLLADMAEVDHDVFFSRVGNRIRFRDLPGRATKTMCYALDATYLGSPFCTVPHGLMMEVMSLLLERLRRAQRWRIQCPLGTDLSGTIDAGQFDPRCDEFSVMPFPVMINRPISSTDASGRVVISRWLMSTDVERYDAPYLSIDQPMVVEIEGGQIERLDGDRVAVASVRRHYERVAEHFGLDPWTVGSWHAGINPHTFFVGPASEDLERWGAVSFGSPRYAHFHTCGTDPGQIAWSVFDPTITLDDEICWREGDFAFVERADVRALIRSRIGADNALDARSDIGI